MFKAMFLAQEKDDRAHFQFISLEFSLPRALLLWSLAGCTVHTLMVFLGSLHALIAITSGLTALGLFKAYHLLSSFDWYRFQSFFRRKCGFAEKENDRDVLV